MEPIGLGKTKLRIPKLEKVKTPEFHSTLQKDAELTLSERLTEKGRWIMNKIVIPTLIVEGTKAVKEFISGLFKKR